MIVDNYNQFGGAHSETAALKNVLVQAGLTAPHSSQPYTEAMLLGIGGGLNAGCFLQESGKVITPTLSVRYQWQDYAGDFLKRICKRIGVRALVQETGGNKTAETNLKQALQKGKPAITWGSRAGMPYYGLPPEWLRYFAHVFVVYGWDDYNRRICIDDQSLIPWHITPQELTVSRSAITALKNRLLTITTTRKPADLRQAVIAGIQDCCKGMLNPNRTDAGLSALTEWAGRLTDTKSAKGWPQFFKKGLPLYRALLTIYDQIETAGTGGGAFRQLYASFLEEAVEVLPGSAKPLLQDAAAQYRKSARHWSALADTALPEEAGILAETRDVIIARYQLFSAKGPAANGQMQKVIKRLAVLEAEAAQNFTLRPKQTRELFGRMSQQVRRIHDTEAKAVALLTKLAA